MYSNFVFYCWAIYSLDKKLYTSFYLIVPILVPSIKLTNTWRLYQRFLIRFLLLFGMGHGFQKFGEAYDFFFEFYSCEVLRNVYPA